MSLKAFHLVFIVSSILLAFGFGGWLLWQYSLNRDNVLNLLFGVASVLIGVALGVYGRYFLKKLKHISYL